MLKKEFCRMNIICLANLIVWLTTRKNIVRFKKTLLRYKPLLLIVVNGKASKQEHSLYLMSNKHVNYAVIKGVSIRDCLLSV